MTTRPADVVVLGAGFGGSLTALLLAKIGLRTILVDRAAHPRFAIGESSTPAADVILRDLARDYDLPWLEPLTRYGSWKQTYPQLTCGPKRGFSYFHHQPNQPFAPRADHANELLVAASSSDDVADTQWLRADVDHFFARQAEAAGVLLLENTSLEEISHVDGWTISARHDATPVRLKAKFIIDATGPAAVLPRALGLVAENDTLHTRSRAVYGHFRGVRKWRDLLAESSAALDDHPFHCDRAALHQVLDNGWMWQLGFDNGVTSLGFVLDMHKSPSCELAPAQEWSQLVERYPSIAAQLAEAELVAPAGGIVGAGRLQRIWNQAAGADWALLPHTAGFIDALHSTGIAHTLSGVERLAGILRKNWDTPQLAERLREYCATTRSEIRLIDQLVGACYEGLPHFRLFVAAAFLYFAAATTYEQRRYGGTRPGAFLCADEPAWTDIVQRVRQRLAEVKKHAPSENETSEFEQFVIQAIDPYNHVGLGMPDVPNMYRYTAAPKA